MMTVNTWHTALILISSNLRDYYDFDRNHRQLELSYFVIRDPKFHQFQIEDTLGSGECKIGCKEEYNHDVHPRAPDDLPQHLVSLHQSKFRLLDGSILWGDCCYGLIPFLHEESDAGGGEDEDNSPEEHELAEVDDALTLQRGEQYEAHDPARGLAHGVAGSGVADIARLQHRQRPAVHRHVLGGRQEVEHEEHGGEGRHVRDSHLLKQFVISFID